MPCLKQKMIITPTARTVAKVPQATTLKPKPGKSLALAFRSSCLCGSRGSRGAVPWGSGFETGASKFKGKGLWANEGIGI